MSSNSHASKGSYPAKPLQQYFKVIYNGNIDLTKYVVRCSYEEQSTLIHQLEVVFRNAENIIGVILQGAKIDLYGGDLSSVNGNYRHLFSGLIKMIRTDPQEEGDYFCNILAYEAESLSSQVKARNYAYPDIGPFTRPFVVEYLEKTYSSYFNKYYFNSSRKPYTPPVTEAAAQGLAPSINGTPAEQLNYARRWWEIQQSTSVANPQMLTLDFLKSVEMPFDEIVKGIAEENGYSYALNNNPHNSTIVISDEAKLNPPNLLRPDHQSDQSDWNYLVSIAEKVGCNVWLELHAGQKWLYFVDIELIKAGKFYKQGSVTGASPKSPAFSFFFPRRKGDKLANPNTLVPSQINEFVSNSQRDKEWYKTKTHIQIRQLSITEDIGLLNAVRPKASNLANNYDPDNLFIGNIGLNYYSRVLLVRDDAAGTVSAGSGKKFREVNAGDQVQLDDKGNIIDCNGAIVTKNPDKYIVTGKQTAYTLNAAKVMALKNSDLDSFNERIISDLNSGELNEELTQDIKRFYDEVSLPLELAIRKEPFQFRGVRLTCTVDGNVNIRSQRWYPIDGILRYSSNEQGSEYFLRALISTFDSDGNFETKLEFFV